ncbi:cell adhesion molecule DSCAML1-like isoform X2 [Acropora muricata]|uniref:cell adhesion molecule DSCAML1-like isoform X2 n=1 Tax=Acropora muricata TaxID=159855 RepID=UPI0034E56148
MTLMYISIMTAVFGTEVKLIVLLSALSLSYGGFAIQPPYPDNQHVIEHTSVAVTCVAYDTDGVKKPERIDFEKRTDDPVTMLQNTIVLKEDGTIYFTNRTEDDGKKLFVTLHIQNVTKEYDSQLTQFLCKGYAAGVHDQGMSFRITVIKRKEIPKIETTKNAILQRGDETTISCRVTAKGSSNAKPKYMAWFKDGELLHSIAVNQLSSELEFKSIVVNTDQVRNAGNYTCVLAMKLYNVLDHNESDSTVVTFLPWFETKKNVEAGIVGKKVNLKCSARGYPLDVEWRVTKKIAEDKKITSCINASADNRFEISRKGVYDPYVLSIVNLNSTDEGDYYCCLASNCSSNIEGICERIRLFVIVLPWFETEKNEETGIVGKKIELKCSARGYPLDVEWRVTKKIAEDKTVTSCINASADNRFEISRKGVYDPYVLSIVNLNSADDGDYYCCLASNCSSNIEGICERIRLFVIDPLSGASMDLSLPCLMLTLFILAASLLNF